MSDAVVLAQKVRQAAYECGFDAVGICASEVLQPERDRYLSWLSDGRQGTMGWMKPDWAIKASDPNEYLCGARSVVCVALSYAGRPAVSTPAGSGRIARYAAGRDYHRVIGERLARLAEQIASLGGGSHSFVDSAPTMDKALASRAGLGWQGKNTNILSRQLGSFTYLGGLVTDLALQPDIPAHDGCGSCRACVVACPTGALKGDYTIDARTCISYLTIEHRGPIPQELRSLIGDWVFGCDICQDVCPPVTALQDSYFPQLRGERQAYTKPLFATARKSADVSS